MRTLAALVLIGAAELAVLWFAVPTRRPERPRAVYAAHVLDCRKCNASYLGICPEGERLRRLAVDHDGLLDPALDR